MEEKKEKVILSVCNTKDKDKYFILGFCYLLSNNDKWANMYFNKAYFEITHLDKEQILNYYLNIYSFANNLWFEHNNKQVSLCVYNQNVYSSIKVLLGALQWNERNYNTQEFKLVFCSIDDTKDKMFLEIVKDAIQIGKKIKIVKEET